MLEIKFPEKLLFLINDSAPLKILYGGRGAGKTENIAVALIILASQKTLRIACFREFQKSIDESVHATIKNQIQDMGLDDEFDVLDKAIRSKRTGSEFIFGAGLRYNINNIKSMARIDIAWVEEAVNVSKTSWDKLEPTIRGRHKDNPNGRGGPFGNGPELWISFNPELDTDETYKRFVLERAKFAPDFALNEDTGEMERYAFCIKLNWSDNPFFPSDLKRKMNILKAADETAWLNVWEGHTKQTLDGAIYDKEIKKALLEGRRGNVPYDCSRPVHTFWDLGHRDKTAIWFVQTIGVEFNLINYYEDSLQKFSFYIKVLQDLNYIYGTHNLPHDGSAETLSNVTPEKQLKAIGWKVRIIKRPSKKFVGINAARTVFDLCNFDEELTSDGWQCLCRYCYDVNKNGNFSREPDHDTPYSHGADAFQTFALSLKSETASNKPKAKEIEKVIALHSHNTGWMA